MSSFGQNRAGHIHAACPVGAGAHAHAATNAPVVVDHHWAIGLTVCGAHRAHFDAGWFLALHAGNGHVVGVFLRNGFGAVVVLSLQNGTSGGVGIAADLNAKTFRVALVHLVLGEFATLHAQHLYPLDAFTGFFATRLVVFFHAGFDATSAANALS
jgi:hypothetical protein